MGIYSTLGGPKFMTSELVGELYEDWSQVRSHGRAARRRKRGHKQNIVTRYRANGQCYHDTVRNVIYLHPDDYLRLKAAVPAPGDHP